MAKKEIEKALKKATTPKKNNKKGVPANNLLFGQPKKAVPEPKKKEVKKDAPKPKKEVKRDVPKGKPQKNIQETTSKRRTTIKKDVRVVEVAPGMFVDEKRLFKK